MMPLYMFVANEGVMVVRIIPVVKRSWNTLPHKEIQLEQVVYTHTLTHSNERHRIEASSMFTFNKRVGFVGVDNHRTTTIR